MVDGKEYRVIFLNWKCLADGPHILKTQTKRMENKERKHMKDLLRRKEGKVFV